MLFNSWTFLFFALIVFPLYYLLPFRFQNIMLLIASYVFYGTWDWRFLTLIVASSAIDYFLSIKIHLSVDHFKRKNFLILSCFLNLGLLGFFKYFNFFIGNIKNLFLLLGLPQVDIGLLHIILPVGISFYTFQTMSYTIDVYFRRITPLKNYLDYSLYVAFFPQLVAGPIERASNLIPQITSPRIITWEKITSGIWLISFGLFKKVVIADNLSLVVDRIFDLNNSPTGIDCLFGIYAFAFQIYGDFSGYSDMARGLSRLMGIELMVNFNLPYISKSPQEFWNRWHISLSTWLKDYLYIPLGGNKKSSLITCRNLFITMFLGGIWHGAAWTFIIWGTYHGIILIVHRMFFTKSPTSNKNIFESIICTLIMFHIVCLGWLIFRANHVLQIFYFINNIFNHFFLDPSTINTIFSVSLFVLLLLIGEILFKFQLTMTKKILIWEPIILTLIWIATLVLAPSAGQSFIYFQF